MYKLIILIISSDNIGIYSEMKRISQIYFNKYLDKIKFFYLEYKGFQEPEIIENGNYLYFNGNESYIPGIYQKSIKAIQYINKKYEYEFILRTNLSSFLNLNNILTYLDTIDKVKYAGGYSFQGFITGTGIFMSRDVGNIVVSNQRNTYIGDDVLISNVISDNNITINDITTYKWGFLTSSDESNLPSNCEYISSGPFNENIVFSSNILYFRIRNEINREIDIQYHKLLLKKIYNIDIDNLSNIETVIQTIVESPIQTIVESPIQTIVESPIQTIVESPIQTIVELPIQTIVEKSNKIRNKKLLYYLRKYICS